MAKTTIPTARQSEFAVMLSLNPLFADLGEPGKLLLVEQKVMLESDATAARAVGRGLVSGLSGIPNYRNNFLRMGFTEADFADGGSDRAADAMLAWGDVASIRARLQEHWDAGADQVAVQVMPKGGALLTPGDERVLELLAG